MIETLIQQYLAPVAGWFVGLFTPAEWKAFMLLIGVTLAGTHTLKLFWRRGKLRGPSHRQVYLLSAAIGFFAAWPIWPAGFAWWIPGVLAGPVSALLFKAGYYLLRRFAPGLANALNANRRHLAAGPPGGFERRQ